MITEQEIISIAQNVMETMCLIDAIPEAESADKSLAEPTFTGCVHITGEWRGAVVLQETPELGRLIASRFLDLSCEEVSEGDILDSAAELTNMIGGNIKALVPGPSFLSIPSVTVGTNIDFQLPGTRRCVDLIAACDGKPLRIMLCESTKPAK